jgi:hypothetical protein
MRTRRLTSAISIATLAVVSLACEGRTVPGYLTTGPSSGARVRLINALTASTAVDFVVDGQVAATNVAFGAASQYVSVELASHQLQARSSATGTSLVDFTRNLTSEGAFSLVPAPGLGQSGALFLTDNPTPVAGQAKIRVVHVAAVPGAVSVYLTAPNGDITTATPTVSTLPFGTASDYVQVAPGTYRVRVTRAASPTEIVVDVGSVILGAGSVRTLLVTDSPNGGLPTILSVLPDAG